MRLHVLAGPRALLRPLALPPAALAALLAPAEGPPLVAPAAPWLARDAGATDHDFLTAPAGDDRIAALAAALRDDFGARFEPLLLLPDLLPGPADPPGTAQAAVAALRALWRRRPAARLALHALALPPAVDAGAGWVAAAGLDADGARAGLDALRDALVAGGGPEGGADPAAVDLAVRILAPGARGGAAEDDSEDDSAGVFDAALRNALARESAARAAAPLAASGLAALPGLAPAAARRLQAWARQGLVPALPLDDRGLGRLTARLVDALLAARGPDA